MGSAAQEEQNDHEEHGGEHGQCEHCGIEWNAEIRNMLRDFAQKSKGEFEKNGYATYHGTEGDLDSLAKLLAELGYGSTIYEGEEDRFMVRVFKDEETRRVKRDTDL